MQTMLLHLPLFLTTPLFTMQNLPKTPLPKTYTKLPPYLRMGWEEPICPALHAFFLKKTGIITLKTYPKILKNGQYKLPPSLRGGWGAAQKPALLFWQLLCRAAVILVLLGWHNKGQAQTFSVSPTSVNVSADERFQITYLLENTKMYDFQAPDLSDFYIVGGPNKSQTTQLVNGSMSSAVSVSYILQPKKAGNYTIPPATVVIGKRQTLRSERVSVRVSAPKPQAKTPPATAPAPARGGSNAGNDDMQVWVSAFPDTTKVYVGQQVTITYRLYTNVDIGNYGIKTQPPFTGFWVQDISPTYQPAASTVTIKNKEYRTVEIKKYALFPQRSGILEIEPLTAQAIARIPQQGGGFWGGFFYANKEIELVTDPIKITVSDLPPNGKPDNFTGAVGQYQIGTAISNPNVQTNESVSLKITIAGAGNPKMIDLPKPNFPPSLDTFDPLTNEESFVQMDKVNGRKTYEYTLIPSEAGQIIIPAIAFSYFDPETRSYQTASAQTITLNVRQGKEIPKAAATPTQQPKTLAPIQPQLRLYQKGSSFFGTTIYYALLALPLLTFAAASTLIARQKQQQTDPLALRQKMAQKEAVQRLALAQSHLQQNNRRAFYDEVIRTVWAYLSHRVHIPASQLDKNNIAAILAQNGVSYAGIEQLLSIIASCEIALFAPAAGSVNMHQIYQNSVQAITQVENELNMHKEQV